MFTIYCALFVEAQEMIKLFQLKKETQKHHFEVFSDVEKGIRIVITGVGAVAAATAVAEISTCYPPEKTDLVCNFGSCAAQKEISIGKVYLCNKLTEECSGRTFYPDVCYRHSFREAELVSCGQIQTPEKLGGRLYDMEAAAVYQAANFYYGPHQMIFIKVVSDHGCTENSDMRLLMNRLMQKTMTEVCPYIETLCEISSSQKKEHCRQEHLRQMAEEEAARIGDELHCSTVMRGELRQLLLYWKLTDVDYELYLEEYRRQGRLPVKDKREGKRILDELKEKL